MGSGDGAQSTVIQNVAVNTVKTVGDMRKVLENFSDNCPMTELSVQFHFPDGKGLLKIISK